MMGWGMEAGNTDIGFMVVRQEESVHRIKLGMTE